MSRFTRPYSSLKEAIEASLPPPTELYTLSVLNYTPAPHSNPQRVKLPTTVFVDKISCGGEHAAVGTMDGEVWTWGRGGFGRLGYGNGNRDNWTPRKVDFNEGR